jgi:hypothetical protein
MPERPEVRKAVEVHELFWNVVDGRREDRPPPRYLLAGGHTELVKNPRPDIRALPHRLGESIVLPPWKEKFLTKTTLRCAGVSYTRAILQ